jgi:hypothetical protein
MAKKTHKTGGISSVKVGSASSKAARQARLHAQKKQALADEKARRDRSEVRQHGQFYDALGRLILSSESELVSKDSICTVLLTLCAKCVVMHDRWISASDAVVKATGLSRATWFRVMQKLRSAGVLFEDDQLHPGKFKIDESYFDMPHGRSDKGAIFVQFYAKLARLILDKGWAEKQPAAARLLTCLVALLSLHRGGSKQLYWLQATQAQMSFACKMSSTSWGPAMHVLTKGKQPIVVRHPKFRTLYAIRPDFIRKAGQDTIPPRDLEAKPPKSRIIVWEQECQRLL